MYSSHSPRRLPTRRKATFEVDTTYTQDLALYSPPFSPTYHHTAATATTTYDAQHDPHHRGSDYDLPLIHDSTLLSSRTSALLRRSSALQASLSHLMAVVEPLKSLKMEHITEAQIADVCFETEQVRRTVGDVERQLEEVGALLDGFRGRKGGRLVELIS